MHVYALYGSSGTGKSSIALELAHRYGIDAIIDDGILIYQGRKIAGASAKYEKTKVQAVKRAIFYYDDQAEEVRQALRELPVRRLLVLATSKRMVSRIVEALDLPPVTTYIPIESIRQEAEIRAARFVRETQGKHAIPVPRVEVEKDLFQRIIHSAQKIFSAKKEVIGETTIVHPPFAGGRIQIHPNALRKMVQAVCSRFPEVVQAKSYFTLDGLPKLHVSLSLQVPFGTPIRPLVRQIQQTLYMEVEYCLNIPPARVDILVQSLRLKR